MKWIPEWLAKAYAALYVEREKRTFEFRDAANILRVADKKLVSKILGKLRRSGYLFSWRDPADPRRRLYRLVGPEDTVRALGLSERARSPEPLDKLRMSDMPYALTGAYAAYQFHRYSAPASIEVAVRAEDADRWYALLADRGVAISVDDRSSEKVGKVSIHLGTGYAYDESELFQMDGLTFLSPESIIARGLAYGEASLEDVLALLMLRRRRLDSRRLVRIAQGLNVLRQLGCAMEILSFESGLKLFKHELIRQIRHKANLEVQLDFPATRDPEERRYGEIAAMWNLRVRLSPRLVKKIVTDLVR